MSRQASRLGVASLLLVFLVSLPAYSQRGGRGGPAVHSISSAQHSSGSRAGSVSRFTVHTGPSASGNFHSSRRDGSFTRRPVFFGPFGYALLPDFYDLDYEYLNDSAYPYTLINPEVAAHEEMPLDTDLVSGSELPAGSYWLIALKDDAIILAADYWLEGSALHCVDLSGDASSVRLSQVDLRLTKDLNRGHGREFQWPRAKSDDHAPKPDGSMRPY